MAVDVWVCSALAGIDYYKVDPKEGTLISSIVSRYPSLIRRPITRYPSSICRPTTSVYPLRLQLTDILELRS